MTITTHITVKVWSCGVGNSVRLYHHPEANRYAIQVGMTSVCTGRQEGWCGGLVGVVNDEEAIELCLELIEDKFPESVSAVMYEVDLG